LVENAATYEPQFAELRNGAHLTPLSGQGKIGRAIELDGIDDFLVVENPSMLGQITSEFTLEAWVLPRKVYNGTVIGCSPASENGSRAFGLSLSQGQLNFMLSDNEGETYKVQSQGSIGVDLWSHLAATFDGFTMRVYINGQADAEFRLQDSGSQSPLAPYPCTKSLVIGGGADGVTGEQFQGLIDEVYIYPKARTLFGRMFRVTAPSIVKIGEPFAVHLAALSEFGSPLPNASERLALSESDNAIVFSTDTYTFAPGDEGEHRFCLACDSALAYAYRSDGVCLLYSA
jgi:hypothetical protein